MGEQLDPAALPVGSAQRRQPSRVFEFMGRLWKAESRFAIGELGGKGRLAAATWAPVRTCKQIIALIREHGVNGGGQGTGGCEGRGSGAMHGTVGAFEQYATTVCGAPASSTPSCTATPRSPAPFGCRSQQTG